MTIWCTGNTLAVFFVEDGVEAGPQRTTGDARGGLDKQVRDATLVEGKVVVSQPLFDVLHIELPWGSNSVKLFLSQEIAILTTIRIVHLECNALYLRVWMC